MKTTVYRVREDVDHINRMGELGWEVLNKSPLIVGREFKMPPNAEILRQWVDLFEFKANTDISVRNRLNSMGYRFKLVYVDDAGKRLYKLIHYDGSPLYKWRVEFATSLGRGLEQEEAILGITFGDPTLNIPAFCDKRVVDKYVPKEIMEPILEADCVFGQEIDLEGQENAPEGDAKPNGGIPKGESHG